jgi:hypothetical protein
MQSLSWVLFGPWSTGDWFGIAIAFLSFSFLIYRRDWPGVAYWTGALLTLTPVVIVSGAFWMGFDRYLYMPSILALLALQPYVVRAASRTRGSRLALCVLGIGLLGYATLQTHRASESYANQEAYDQGLIRDHSDDPSIHYYFARMSSRRSDRTGLRKYLSSMPSPPWPRPIIIPTYKLAVEASDSVKTREAIDALVATVRKGPRCETVRAQLEDWSEKATDPVTGKYLEEQRAALSCER